MAIHHLLLNKTHMKYTIDINIYDISYIHLNLNTQGTPDKIINNQSSK